ncbi:MAG: DNA repair protein RecO [Lachnospiraceae bacterium]|nr:DNA repair protein RecO [Lachnospiraceae bacterium]
MSDKIELTGMVLLSQPVGDYDKRIVVLTKEFGKITCFARGARRVNSALLASTDPFTFGDFELFPGKDAYSVAKVTVKEHFRDLTENPTVAMYGFYFLEVVNYYTRENLDATDYLKLLYVSLKALLSDKVSLKLVRRIFEYKAMQLFGEYPVLEEEDGTHTKACKYAFYYNVQSRIEKLYTFTVTDDVLKEMGEVIDKFRDTHIDRKFNSLEMLHLQID